MQRRKVILGAAAVLCSLDVPAAGSSRSAGKLAMPGALVSPGASPEIPPSDRIYDPLIGSWRVKTVDTPEDGSRHEDEGEWHFAYTLEGRAVQDVWIVPARAKRTAGTSKNFNRYGSTIRFYEPASRSWRLVWINPVSGTLQTLSARAAGGRVVHMGMGTDSSLMRWTFQSVSARAFHWTGEQSKDGGLNWWLEAQFFGQR